MLKSIQNIFNIEYTTTDYIPFNKNKIVYRLEGFSDTWNVLEQNTITYTNLAPGNYTLIVKAENVNEKLVPPSRLQIEILPPFYRTIWAYLAYIISIIILTYYIIHTYHHRLKLQESLKYEKRHIEDIEKLNQAKLRFFTNISHEFRTPLTTMLGSIRQLCAAPANTVPNRELLNVLQDGILRMLQLVNQLLDFNKLDNDNLGLEVQQTNLTSTIKRIISFFNINAQSKNITLSIQGLHHDILYWADEDKVEKILSNLLSNADYFDKETKKQLYLDIYDDSMWLINLIENMLSVTRLEEGRMNLNISVELVDDVIQEALRHVDRKKDEHTITVEHEDEFLLARMDSRLIVQMVINLVDNAIKYTQKGSHIDIRTGREGKNAVISVADDGPGISDEMKEHIFETFYTGTNKIADSRRSLGLGLALCKSIVNVHGGEIKVSDAHPHGAVFQFTLPAGEVYLYEQTTDTGCGR